MEVERAAEINIREDRRTIHFEMIGDDRFISFLDFGDMCVVHIKLAADDQMVESARRRIRASRQASLSANDYGRGRARFPDGRDISIQLSNHLAGDTGSLQHHSTHDGDSGPTVNGTADDDARGIPGPTLPD